MKRIILITLLLSGAIDAEMVHWIGDYDSALQIAKQKHKPLMVLLVKQRCPTCNSVIRDVFMDKQYIEKLNTKFIPVIVTYEGRASYPVEMYYSTEFPTLFFVDSASEHFLVRPFYRLDITEERIKSILSIGENV